MEKKKRIIGRYTLVLEDSLKEQFKHCFNEYNNSEKVPLAVIDNLTTNFKDKEELFNYINDRNIVKCDYQNAYITYQHNKKIKTLPVVFEDISEIKELSKIKDSNISIDNRMFLSVKNSFLRKIQDNYYKTYFIRTTEDKKLAEYIDLYTYNGHYTYDPFNRDKIVKKLQSYKQCREAILSIKEYDAKMQKINRR